MESSAYLIIPAQIFLALYFVIGAMMDYKFRQQTLDLMQQKKIPYKNIFYPAAVALKFFGGLAVMFNIFAGIAAIALAIFTLIANIIFNDFWAEEGMKKQFTLLRFLCNLAVVGGLMLVAAL